MFKNRLKQNKVYSCILTLNINKKNYVNVKGGGRIMTGSKYYILFKIDMALHCANMTRIICKFKTL